MAERTYLYGYEGNRFEWDDLVARHWRVGTIAPEVLRRLRALFDAAIDAGFDAGIGGGARTRAEQAAAYKKDPGNFTPAGISWHENDAYLDEAGNRWAVAIDAVPAGAARTWMKSNAGRFGLVAVDDDWHLQPIGLPASRRKYWPGTFLTTWTLPDSPPPVDPTPIPPPLPLPPPGGRFMHATVKAGDVNADVYALQSVLRSKAGQLISVDGEFGGQTVEAVKNLQRFCGLTVDGIVGPKTWAIVDSLANS